MPPQNQNAYGTGSPAYRPFGRPYSEKSSEPISGSAVRTAPSGMTARWAAITRSTTSAVLTVAGGFSRIVRVGGSGQPAAWASAPTIRSTAATARAIEASDRARRFTVKVAVSGMMFDFVPAWKVPTVTTSGSSGDVSRAAIVCSRVMAYAAVRIGSTVTN